nr:MAG TPA: hypothetical protein [Caudoviricetes sp.]
MWYHACALIARYVRILSPVDTLDVDGTVERWNGM